MHAVALAQRARTTGLAPLVMEVPAPSETSNIHPRTLHAENPPLAHKGRATLLDNKKVAINADFSKRVVMDSNSMPWKEAAFVGSWSKRFELVVEPDKAQVTSVAKFPGGTHEEVHTHQGDCQEVLVLEGDYADDGVMFYHSGDYLVNWGGYSHSPRSVGGCMLFFKAGKCSNRNAQPRKEAVHTRGASFLQTDQEGLERLILFEDPAIAERTVIERLAPGTSLEVDPNLAGKEIYVLSGSFSDEWGMYSQGVWLRLPPGFVHCVESEEGCTMFVKRGHLLGRY